MCRQRRWPPPGKEPEQRALFRQGSLLCLWPVVPDTHSPSDGGGSCPEPKAPLRKEPLGTVLASLSPSELQLGPICLGTRGASWRVLLGPGEGDEG